jgi:hypothetical protein
MRLFLKQIFEKVIWLFRSSLLIDDKQPVHQLDGFRQNIWAVHFLLGVQIFARGLSLWNGAIDFEVVIQDGCEPVDYILLLILYNKERCRQIYMSKNWFVC